MDLGALSTLEPSPESTVVIYRAFYMTSWLVCIVTKAFGFEIAVYMPVSGSC